MNRVGEVVSTGSRRKCASSEHHSSSPDLDAAPNFLSVLDQTRETCWTFQTFDDRAGGRKDSALSKIRHGTLSDHVEALTALNQRGGGIFVMVNEGDGGGRSATNVTRVRALFVDIDAEGPKRITHLLEASIAAGMPPSVIIQTSPGRYSAFWSVADCPLDKFRDYQCALALRFGGDTSVCDLPRVMRLPGFFHNKGTPFRTELMHARAAIYNATELIRALCPPPDREAVAIALPLPEDRDEWTDAVANAEAGLRDGGRNVGIFKAACALRARGTPRTEAEQCARTWAANAIPPFDGDEAVQCVASAYRDAYIEADAQQRALEATRTGIDDAVESELKRLATLGDVAYDRAREESAKSLGIRVSTLDEQVDRYRSASSQVDLAKKLLGDAADPEPWPDPVNGDALLERMQDRFQRHARLPDHAAPLLATWCLATWALDAFTIFPFLRLHSATPGCGKSTVLDVIERLCRKPFRADNASGPVVFRLVDATQCSLLLDEAETLFGDQVNESLRGILDGAHRITGAVLRIFGEGRDMAPTRYRTWGPKAFAHLRRLPGTVADRSVTVTLVRAVPNDRPERIKDDPEWHALRRMALRWSTDHLSQIAAKYQEDPPDFLPNRVGDNWNPLLSVAAIAGGTWPDRLLEAARNAVAESKAADSQETGIALLADIRRIFDERQVETVSSSDLLSSLTADEDSRWADFSKGRAMSPRHLARLLQDFRIRPSTVRLNDVSTGAGQRTPKGYRRGQFEDAWKRYLTNEGDN